MTTTPRTKMATTDTTSQNSEHLALLSAAQPQPQYSNTSTNTHQEEDDEEEGDLERDFPPISPLPTPPKKPAVTTNNKAPPTSQTTTEHQFASAVKENRRQDVPKPLTPPALGLTPISVGTAASRNPPERPQNEWLNRVFREVARRAVEGKGNGEREGV
ncbi:hypothetical protein M409DRAFT_57544 [Zasmidium cellare ATCC 36951]|uniref:Uncharacterized protein n=1 Tax=Zasmidium cellare ATCC 36951 TaxID=1080233 RepID=A0A6A6CCS1_ZASCE|nr:uncharacterized protein M409DRAFT_57544 [Zasmidium cellare ATCC 36951]KAF2163246.1 hypothetical protein M409DRAFT_57544 [Zasmidium cellare ATCC 36951]